MVKITSKDIEALREYLGKLEALEQAKPKNTLTAEEWDEIFKSLFAFGEIPDKYKMRVKEMEIEEKTGLEKVLDDSGNPVLDENGEPRFRHVVYDTPIKRKAYYDVVEEEHDQKITTLNKKYHDIVKKALLFYIQSFEEKPKTTENQTSNIEEIIKELFEDPVIKREIEKEAAAAQKNTLAPLGSLPNGEIIYWLIRTLKSSKGGRMVEQSSGNRHEKITILQKGDSLIFTRENKQTKTTQTIEMKNALKYLGKNKTFIKLLIFSLQKMTAQNFPLEVGFSLQELVDLGMYSTTSNAWRAVKSFYEQQLDTPLSGTVKKGKKTVKEEEGVLFYHRKVDNNFITLYVNENLNTEFIANYFTVFPRFAYALSNNAFSLVWYIFYLARQNSQDIKDKKTFTINLEKVRENLGLPSVEEVKHRKYRDNIIDPIETAIEEIEDALQNVPEAKECSFTITLYGTDTSNIREWLQGYLEIGLKGDFAETFVKLAEKAEQDRKQWERIKKAEQARIAARAEAKEAQDEPKRTTRKHK